MLSDFALREIPPQTVRIAYTPVCVVVYFRDLILIKSNEGYSISVHSMTRVMPSMIV